MNSTLISTGAMTADEIARLRAKHYNASVVGVRDVNPGLRILRVQPDWGRLDFQAGQYTVLATGSRRSASETLQRLARRKRGN
jgi:hypothetical protein